MQHEFLSFACWDRLFILGSLVYERHEDNFDTVQDRLLEPSGHDYKPGGLVNIRKKDWSVPEITWGFWGCEYISYFLEYEWSDGHISKKIKDQRLYFSYINQTRLDENVLRRFGSFVWPSFDGQSTKSYVYI